MKTKSILPLFKSKGNWIRYTTAHNKDGDWVDPSDDDAVSFCLQGATMRVYGYYTQDYERVINKLCDAIESNKRWDSRHRNSFASINVVCDFNNHDKTTFKDIIKVIKKADV